MLRRRRVVRGGGIRERIANPIDLTETPRMRGAFCLGAEVQTVICVTAIPGWISYSLGMVTLKNNDHAAWLHGPAAKCEVTPSVENPWRLILLGAPGVGKGTQADLLSRELKACHLSTGDVFRAASKSECELSPAMKAATEYMRRGSLVPDRTVELMVRERAGCVRCAGGFILDGYPRTLVQATSLEALMESEGLALAAVVNYELPTSAIIARLSGRRTCKECRTAFHIVERPPKTEDICDRCGGTLFQRDDDRPESIKVRLEAYEESTAPLISFYAQLGLLLPIDASGTADEICAKTLAELKVRRQARPATVR